MLACLLLVCDALILVNEFVDAVKHLKESVSTLENFNERLNVTGEGEKEVSASLIAQKLLVDELFNKENTYEQDFLPPDIKSYDMREVRKINNIKG